MARNANFLYTAYRFRADEQDPIVDKMRTIFDDHKTANGRLSYRKVAEESGLSEQTIGNWFRGKTRRPQFCSIAAFARSQGYDFVLAPLNQNASQSASTIGTMIRRFPTTREIQRGNSHHVSAA
jgi:hypothetical protein